MLVPHSNDPKKEEELKRIIADQRAVEKGEKVKGAKDDGPDTKK